MNNSNLNIKSLEVIKKVRSIKKPKEINPLLDIMVKNLEDQIFSLELQINQLREENKRLNRL